MTGLATQREYQVRDWYRAQGWIAFRAPASLGVADVIALKAGEAPQLVEVKSSPYPFEHFRPADRARLIEAAEIAGAHPLLVHWPKGGHIRFVHPPDWPTIGGETTP